MGKQLVIRLRGPDEVGARPVLPVNQVARDGEGVIGSILAVGVIGREVEHDIESLPPVPSQRGGIHADYLGITSDDARGLVEVDGITLIALPPLEVVAEGNADALGFEVVVRVDATGIIEHDEALAKSFLWVIVDGALILCELFPPLYILVVDAQQGLVGCLPFVGLGDVATCPSHTDMQGFAHSLIACTVPSDVGHPVLALIATQLVAPVPCPVDKGRESAPLVHVPAAVLI